MVPVLVLLLEFYLCITWPYGHICITCIWVQILLGATHSLRFFLARDSIAYMLSALYAIAHPSVRLLHGCIIEKRLKLGL